MIINLKQLMHVIMLRTATSKHFNTSRQCQRFYNIWSPIVLFTRHVKNIKTTDVENIAAGASVNKAVICSLVLFQM